MLKVMIVEDEALERKALRFLINNFYKDSMNIICEVSNGRDAVDKALNLKPDIILMDINMPVMDGLEAGKLIKDKYEDIEIIILTAFNYFEYAKKAINIGVSDYLLKPFSNEEFCSSINKLMDKINSKNMTKHEKDQLNKNLIELIPLVEKEAITNIVYGTPLTEDEFNKYKKIFGINNNKFCCIVFNCTLEGNFNEEDVYTIKHNLNYLFDEIIGYICLNDIVIFVFDKDLESKILSKKLEKVLINIQEDFKSNKGIKMTTGIGCSSDDVSKLYLSYKQAKIALENNKNKIIYYNNQGLASKSGLNMIDKETIICGKIINEDLNGALKELEDIFSYLLSNNEVENFFRIKEKVYELYNIIIKNVSEFIGEDIKNFKEENIHKNFKGLEEISDLKYFMNMIIKKLIDTIENYKKNKNITVVEKVKKYIANNYMKDINLDEVSAYVSMSSYYLSRIFRKVEGMNFRDYIIKVRMEKAKKMLSEGEKTIKQIAIEVGYLDQNYFSKAFKKYMQLSPKEYSNL